MLPPTVLGLQVVKGLAVFSAFSGNDRELSSVGCPPRYRKIKWNGCSTSTVFAGLFLVIWEVKDLFLCHLSVPIENGVLSSEVSAILDFDRAGPMGQSSDERCLG